MPAKLRSASKTPQKGLNPLVLLTSAETLGINDPHINLIPNNAICFFFMSLARTRRRNQYGAFSRVASSIARSVASTVAQSLAGGVKRSLPSGARSRSRAPRGTFNTVKRKKVTSVNPYRNEAQIARLLAQRRYKNNTIGAYGGRLRRRRWKKYSDRNTSRLSFEKKGVVFVQENRGTVGDSNCVYLGHSIATSQVVLAVARAIIRALFQQCGQDIQDFGGGPGFSGTSTITIYYKYYKDVTNSGSWTTITMPFTSGSYDNMATTLITNWVANMTDPTPTVEGPWMAMKFLEFGMYTSSGATQVNQSKITATQLKVDFDFASYLCMQNQTLAAAAEDINDELVTNVENNPLKGRLYRSKNMSNGFIVKYKPNTSSSTYNNLVANRVTGVIAATYTNIADDMYAKPPDPFYFDSTHAVGTRLNPGDVKRDKIKYRNSMTLDKFMSIFANSIWRNSNAPVGTPWFDTWVNYGLAHMVAFEKLIDSGSSEQNIRLGYELTQYYKCKITYKQSVVAPIIETNLA